MATVSGIRETMTPQKKSPAWVSYLILILILVGIIYGVYAIIKNLGGSGSDNENVKVTEINDDEEDTSDTADSTTEDTTDTTDETPAADDTESLTGLDALSNDPQSVGEESNEAEFTLESITDSSKTGYHEFVFTLSPKDSTDDGQLYAEAKYVASAGAIRVDMNMVTTDNSGIGYQKSRSINKDGVIRLYHNVSSDQTEELYDVGVSAQTPFHIQSQITPDGNTVITLDVKYPGESDADVNFGSTDFSSELQKITGATKSDGAKVTAYSYNTSSGVLSIVFSVSGTTDKPVPSATAQYEGNLLTLRFTSIASDTIAKMPAALDLPGGITMVWEMEDSDTSIYTFDGASGDFRLSGTSNPNQVTLEIQL